MSEKRKCCLILFTEFYPFSDYHAYLNEEVVFLSKAFDELLIVSRDTKHDQKFSIPKNAKVYRTDASYDLNFQNAIQIFFRHQLYRELKIIRQNKYCRINYATLKILMASLLAVSSYEKLLKRMYLENSLESVNLFIYSWWMNDYAMAFDAIKKVHPDVRLYSRVHSSDLYFFRHPHNYLPLKKQMIELLDGVFAISEHAKKYLVLHHHLNQVQTNKILVRRLGTKNNAAIKGSTGSNPSYFTIASNSFITPLKRVELIAESLFLIGDIPIHWVHFGNIPHNEKEFELFKLKIQTMFCKKPNIKVELNGYIENVKVLNFYETTHVDALINVSKFEGTAVSIIEAMSFGIPIIATDVGATKELVNKENGILLPEALTPELLASALKKFLSMGRMEKDPMRTASRKKWEENFNAEKNYQNLINEFFR